MIDDELHALARVLCESEDDAELAEAIDRLIARLSVVRAGAVSLPLDGAPPETCAALLGRAVTTANRRARDAQANVLCALYSSGATSIARDFDERRDFLVAIVDDQIVEARIRQEAGMVLLHSDDVESLRVLAARVDAPNVLTDVAVRALLKLDPCEAFELLQDRYREDPTWRRRIAMCLDRTADPRFVDEALALFHTDPWSASMSLASIATARAHEELVQLKMRTKDDPEQAVAVAAAFERLVSRRTS
jgi:hypothetical protein